MSQITTAEPLPSVVSPVVSESQSVEAVKDITCGSIAGMIGKLVEYPFDTVKVRLQSQVSSQGFVYAGPLDCFRKSIQQDGVLNLYRGISAPLVGAALETSSLFVSYRMFQHLIRSFTFKSLDEPLPLSNLLVCGAGAGAATSLVLTPVELIKCKMQIPGPSLAHTFPINRSIWATISEIYRTNGIRGYWRGQTGTLFRETGGSAAWFGTYEALCTFLKRPTNLKSDLSKTSLPIYQQMLAGAFAGMAYNFSFYPADTIKSRIQTGSVTELDRRVTFWSVGKDIWQKNGLQGFYRGCGITMFRAAPSSAIIFSIYEALRGELTR